MAAPGKRAERKRKSNVGPLTGRNSLDKATRLQLLAAATRARGMAVAPYSGFQVGAALLARDGKIFPGANVESASYGLTCCAERVALFKALTTGARDFYAIAVVARVTGGPMPCGACRQLLMEYAPAAVVCVADSARLESARIFQVSDLLPAPFLVVPPDSH